MKKLIILLPVFLFSCELHLFKARELYEEASWYNERGLEISEYNTLERVKYYLQEYRKCKQNETNSTR